MEVIGVTEAIVHDFAETTVKDPVKVIVFNDKGTAMDAIEVTAKNVKVFFFFFSLSFFFSPF
jgi:hypothetical protein